MDRDGQGRPVGTHAPPAVVVGAGASGLLCARALLRYGHPAVVLVERNESWGAGPAYSTSDPEHLLNVPASKLSADSVRPNDFAEWAAHRIGGAGSESFLPRALYGEYLKDSLHRVDRCTSRPKLVRITAEVVDVELRGRPEAQPVRVKLGDGTSIAAEQVVLALGNPPPRPLPGNSPAILDDPWSVHRRSADPDDSIVLVGTGLTAVDVALSLAARRHRGPIRMVSRRGLLPRRHVAGPAVPLGSDDVRSLRSARTARSLLVAMRAAIAEAGGDWRAVFDAIRNDTNEIWRGLPDAERARLLRHAARYWEIHRHRMPPDAAARVAELVASGRIELRAGAVTGIDGTAVGAGRVRVRHACGAESILTADRVVNCSGPNFDLRRAGSRLLCGLFTSGAARPGPLGFGLDVTADGSLIDCRGRVSSSVSVVGPLRRGVEWETTAIPDIRRQVEALAPRLVTGRLRQRASIFARSAAVITT
jgi:uncharacterized NAD(P)/FAD-binding protein YdhS